jgi:hypothetical protein
MNDQQDLLFIHNYLDEETNITTEENTEEKHSEETQHEVDALFTDNESNDEDMLKDADRSSLDGHTMPMTSDEEEASNHEGESLWLFGGSIDEYRAGCRGKDMVKATKALRDMLVVYATMASTYVSYTSFTYTPVRLYLKMNFYP